MQHLLRSGVIQAKLAVSQPGDPEEQEADRTADRIMRSHASVGSAATSCSCGADEEGMCEECRQKAAGVSRKAADSSPPHASNRVLDTVKRSPGHPLDAATRAFFEPRFGRDLSSVRIHSDAAAAASARSIQAHAYAAGDDLVFDTGRFAPETQEGRRLLAHELTHVLQQGSAIDVVRRDADGGTSDPTAVAQPTVVDRVIAALQEPQENGVGNYTEAYSILNGLWMVDMLQQIEQLRARGDFDLLKQNDPGNFPRVAVAIAAVAAKGTPTAAQFPAKNPSFSAIEEQQQHEVATFLGLPWPIPQTASTGGEQGPTNGEILTGVLAGAAVVGAVVFFIAFPEALPILAIIVSTSTADVAAATAIDAGATVAVELVVDAAAVGGEEAAVTTVLGETATATTTEAATTTAVTEGTTAATTTTTATTSAATKTAAVVAGVTAASTTLSSDSSSSGRRGPDVDTEDQESPCQAQVVGQRGGNTCHDQFATLVSGSPREWGVETPEGLYVDFDGLGLGKLLYEVKTEYGFLLSNSPSTELMRKETIARFIEQSSLQLAIAERCGYSLLWVFNNKAVAELVQGYIEANVTSVPFKC